MDTRFRGYDEEGMDLMKDDPWRTLEASTHKPGALASLLHKRVYTHNERRRHP